MTSGKPIIRVVSLYKTVEILEQLDTLSGEDVLPDFLLSLTRISP
ncbi:hypothetical protein NON20_08290 [Synechocystis sp. B12]|nr:hypothetical protein NON20_08290 [Synechocystis sp. B12]